MFFGCEASCHVPMVGIWFSYDNYIKYVDMAFYDYTPVSHQVGDSHVLIYFSRKQSVLLGFQVPSG